MCTVALLTVHTDAESGSDVNVIGNPEVKRQQEERKLHWWSCLLFLQKKIFCVAFEIIAVVVADVVAST
jgi:hypothetical protein